MSSRPNLIFTLIVVLVCFLLQASLAPNILIGGVAPNFMTLCVILLAMRTDPIHGCTLGFILGLLGDLMGSGPVGALAFTLTATGFLVSTLVSGMDQSSKLLSISVIAAASLAVEMVYGILCTITGDYSHFFKSIFYRMLPGAVYDCVFGIILLFLIGLLSRIEFFNQGSGGARPAAGNVHSMSGTMPGSAASFARKSSRSSIGHEKKSPGMGLSGGKQMGAKPIGGRSLGKKGKNKGGLKF